MTEADLLEAFSCASPYPIYARDAQHRWIFANTAFRALTECVEVPPGVPDSLLHPDCLERILRAERRVLEGGDSLDEEVLLNGVELLTLRHPLTLASGEMVIVGCVISVLKATEQLSFTAQEAIERLETTLAPIRQMEMDRTRMLEQKLEMAELAGSAAAQAARTDPATGLRNRIGFDDDLAMYTSGPISPDSFVCLAYLDLDRFKFINDSFGHKAGDAVLRTVARRLLAWPEVRSLARMGGDEFAILFEHPRVAPHVLSGSIGQLRKRLFRPARFGDKLISVSGSIGLSVYGLDADSPEQMKLHADSALIEAKRLGREQVMLFDAGLAIRTHRRNTLEGDLHRAVQKGLITPVFQPIVDACTRQIVGAEVLARWNHPALGPIPPEEFISIATDCGLISTLDLSLMRRACALARGWLTNGLLSFVSFNSSGLEIVRPGYAEEVLKLLKRAGVRPDKVCIEIVESAIIHDLDRALVNIRMLKDQGAMIALDDYGTGYSNLRALLDLPVDRIKIDRSLISAIGSDDRAMKLIVSLSQLAGVVGAALIAEGVEDDAQAAFLEGMGCRFLQGYRFGVPAEAPELEVLLNARRTQAA